MIYVNVRAIIERTMNGKTEIIIQRRNKPGQEYLELPGGRINEYESLYDALKREVFEETGLTVTNIEGSNGIVLTGAQTSLFKMECAAPFAVYQTLSGPVDSMGTVFLCSAEGEPAQSGDETLFAAWTDLERLKEIVEQPGSFSDIDRATVVYYLKTKE